MGFKKTPERRPPFQCGEEMRSYMHDIFVPNYQKMKLRKIIERIRRRQEQLQKEVEEQRRKEFALQQRKKEEEEKKKLQQREENFQRKWCSSFAQKIQDYVIGCDLCTDIFHFALSSQKEERLIEDSIQKTTEPIPQSQIIEEPIFADTVPEVVPLVVPLAEVAKEVSKISPPLQVEHIDFIIGELLDEPDDEPQIQDFIPQNKFHVLYSNNMIRGRIIFQGGE